MFLPYNSNYNLVIHGSFVELSESVLKYMTPKNLCWLSSLTSNSLISLLDLHTILKCRFLWHLWQTESLAGQLLLSCFGDCPHLVQLWIWLRVGFVEGEIGFLDCCLPCFFLIASAATCSVSWFLTVCYCFLTLSHWWAKLLVSDQFLLESFEIVYCQRYLPQFYHESSLREEMIHANTVIKNNKTYINYAWHNCSGDGHNCEHNG